MAIRNGRHLFNEMVIWSNPVKQNLSNKFCLKRRRRCYGLRNEMDELQFSCPKSMFKIHEFDDVNEAKKAKLSVEGAESHIDDKYWVAEENLLSEILIEQVAFVVKKFNLKVPLGMEWKLGRNWAECH